MSIRIEYLKRDIRLQPLKLAITNSLLSQFQDKNNEATVSDTLRLFTELHSEHYDYARQNFTNRKLINRYKKYIDTKGEIDKMYEALAYLQDK